MRRALLVLSAMGFWLGLQASPALAAEVELRDETPTTCTEARSGTGVDGCLHISDSGARPDVVVVVAILLAFIGYTAADGMTPRRSGARVTST